MIFLNYFFDNYNKILRLSLQHFYLFIISLIIAIIVGVILSIIATEEGREKIGKVIVSITGAAQAVLLYCGYCFSIYLCGHWRNTSNYFSNYL